MGPLVTAMSAEASDMSSWLLMGLPAVAMMGGLAEASWTAIGLAIGTYINWLIVAKRLRVYSSKIDAFTLPDFFAKRFGDSKHMLLCSSSSSSYLIQHQVSQPAVNFSQRCSALTTWLP